VKIDRILSGSTGEAGANASNAEALGYDGLWSVEMAHDPFLPLAMAAGSTDHIDIGTSIAVGFARSPMTLANTAYDLQELSGGRMHLGLGSQIKPHITRRFSMEWSRPAARMAEMISAMRAIWDSWMTGDKLDFQGDFYSHTLMTPMFNPGPLTSGPPKVWLAGVGPKMTETAGRVADGFICHAFTTERYLNEVTLPILTEARSAAGLTMDDFDVIGPGFVITGETEEQMAAVEVATKRQIAFYGSTPAYRPVLELHGWGELQTQLNVMSKQGQWAEMGDLIDDEMVEAFAIRCEPADLPRRFAERWQADIDRVTFHVPDGGDMELWGPILDDLKAL